MQTSSIVTLAKNEFPDKSRVTILMYLNELQQMIYTRSATNQMLMYDSTTGTDHALNTVAGTYEYSIGITTGFSHNAWRIGEVYSSCILDQEDVIKYDGQPGHPAKIVFRTDPSTSSYFVRCYRYPTTISTETIQLEIPAGFHLTHIFEGLCGLIEKSRSGKSERWDVFQMKLIPDLIMKMNESMNSYNVTYKGY